MSMDIDRAGFVERGECCCENAEDRCTFRGMAWWWPHSGHSIAWTNVSSRICLCDHCGAELSVFTDPDGTRHPMVRRAGFWREVAVHLSECVAALRGFDIGSIGVLSGAVESVLATDGLNATLAGETMNAQQRTEIQWLDKSEARDGDASDGVREH